MPSSIPSELYQVIWQTRRLFQRLRATSEELLDGSGINTSQRAVLEFLHKQEPQTVPQIAREKSVSRQHIQSVVNELLTMGLIAAIDNPAHKRSSLIQMTTTGRALFAAILEKESALLALMAREFSRQDLATTLSTLKSLDAYLASGDWRTSCYPNPSNYGVTQP